MPGVPSCSPVSGAYLPCGRLAGRRSVRPALLLALLLASIGHAATEPCPTLRGLPLTRLYAFEEIGNVTRGCQLTFDEVGRVTLVQGGAYVALNDSTWLNLAEQGGIQMLATVCAADGSTYYGALGSWGRVVATANGQVRPVSMVPDAFPPWVRATNFVQILPTPSGVYFAGWNGIVFWNRATGQNTFFALPAVACIFVLGNDVFASSHEKGVRRLDPNDGSLQPTQGLDSTFVDNVVPLSAGRYLLSTTDGRLLVYARGALTPWTGPLVGDLSGRVSALKKLVEGEIAVAVVGRGLFITDEHGAIRTALTTAEYHRVVHLANNEPGVLWAAVESGVTKVLYGSPVSLVGQALGLPVWFPQVVAWKNSIVVASAGQLYVPVPTIQGTATRFELMPGQPESGAWAIAAEGDRLLAGNRDGVFSYENGSFVPVVSDLDAARLVLVAPDLCLVLGDKEIAALRREAGTWRECAARVPGIGYPAVVHASNRAAWIEVGADRVARVSFEADKLKVCRFDEFPWPDPRWVHVSVVGDTVILAGLPDKIFFDERTGQFCDAPELRQLLDRAPYWVARVCEDDDGNLFASHGHGVFAIVAGASGHTFDTTTYDLIDDQAPILRRIPGHGIWASTGPALYHIAGRQESGARPGFAPRLLSLRDRRTGAELLNARRSPGALERLPYRQNSLDFRFFAGSYAARRSPTYEVRIDDHPWTSLGSNSLFTLSDLREGTYRLDIRLMSRHGVSGPPVSYHFAIAAPWYRSSYAYGGYALLGAALVYLLNRLSVRQARASNAALERVAADRTKELRQTMERLRQETETSATLAERNRLAGEIHDSLEQGFTGLALQLETTAGFANCPPEVKAGLATALNMVTFGRNELRHVVRDLHSAMLDTADLPTALRHMVAQVAPDSHSAVVVVQGTPRKLGPSTEHHLLRIAQEAITNAVKHAAALQLTVTLAFNERDVQLTIADNGCGFDPSTAQLQIHAHFGLPGMRSRARMIEAVLEITSRPGAGTCIALRVPLDQPTATPDAPIPA